jgi:hypothetical protein
MKFRSNPKSNNIFELTYHKYQKREKISYEEYVVLLTTNDEIWFSLNNKVYQVDHGAPGITSMFITEFDGSNKISERSEDFSSIIDMLHHFKIEGKTIKELWDDVAF